MELPKQHATSRCGTRAAGGNPRSWRTDGTRAELVTVTVPASAGASGRSGHTQAQAGTGRNASLGRICVPRPLDRPGSLLACTRRVLRPCPSFIRFDFFELSDFKFQVDHRVCEAGYY